MNIRLIPGWLRGLCATWVCLLAVASVAAEPASPAGNISTTGEIPAPLATRLELTNEGVPSAQRVPTTIPTTDRARQVAANEYAPSGEESLSADQLTLRRRLRRVIDSYQPYRQNTAENTCWELMHSIVAYGVKSEVLRGGANGRPVNSVGWLCHSGVCKNDRLLTVKDGRVTAKWGVGVQGHQGQFLAIMAQSRVPANFAMQVDQRNFTVQDLIESEMITCERGIELTFKLISLAHYLDSDTTWTNQAGETWSIPRLIQEEIKAPIRGAACGGTHRLMGLSYAVRKRQFEQRPLDGQYERAAKFVRDYHQYTFSLQNTDGSFSTEWFSRRANQPDINRRVQTTGHILEWLVFSLPFEQLDDPRIVRAVNYLANTLANGQPRQWEIGPLGHALHALIIYDERRFAPSTPSAVTPTPELLAERAPAPARLPTPTAPPKPLPPTPSATVERLPAQPQPALAADPKPPVAMPPVNVANEPAPSTTRRKPSVVATVPENSVSAGPTSDAPPKVADATPREPAASQGWPAPAAPLPPAGIPRQLATQKPTVEPKPIAPPSPAPTPEPTMSDSKPVALSPTVARRKVTRPNTRPEIDTDEDLPLGDEDLEETASGSGPNRPSTPTIGPALTPRTVRNRVLQAR